MYFLIKAVEKTEIGKALGIIKMKPCLLDAVQLGKKRKKESA
mgnify:CR=1 FL=1